MPKKEDIIYASGLIDADGCITTSSDTCFRVTLSNTDEKILHWLKSVFGGSINNLYLPKNPNHNLAWKWVVASKSDVTRTLEHITPYLKIKRKQAECVLKHLKKYPSTKGYRNRNSRNKELKDFLVNKNKLRMLKTDKHYFRGK